MGFLVIVAVAGLVGCSSGEETGSKPVGGAAIYKATCATCHGAQGNGFIGPSLVDSTARFDEPAEIAVVTSGRGEMPAFGGQLTPADITAVVRYVRSTFRSGDATTTSPVAGPTLPSSAPSEPRE